MKQQRLAAVAAVLAMMVVPATASAATPTAASGSWDDCNIAPVVRAGGPNLTVWVGITENFSGTMVGTYAGTERDQVYADGSATFHGAGTFTGSVNGKSGTASYTYEGVAPAGQPFTATWTLIGKTGALAKVKGSGAFGGSFIDVSAECDGGIYAGTYAGAFVGS